MNKKTITLILTTLLAVMGVKADVIPSSYYSEVGEGTFYIYDVTSQKFVGRGDAGSANRIVFESTPVKTFTLAAGENSGYTIRYDLTSTYMMYNHAGQGNSWGSDFWMDADGSNKKADWNFTLTSDNKYKISSSYSYEGDSEKTGGVAKFLQGGVWATESEESAHEYALITLSSYYSYLASVSMIPSSRFSTPATGTYYIYNVRDGKFLKTAGVNQDSNNKSLLEVPVAVTITSADGTHKGGGDYILSANTNEYIKFGHYGGQWLWSAASVTNTLEWKFNSCDANTFTISVTFDEKIGDNSGKNYGELAAGTYYMKNETNLTGNEGEAGLYALISAEDYDSWQNSFVLDETNAVGFSSTRDIYNVNPTVNRTMTANVWNTLVVPFDMAIPSGWTVKEPTKFEDGTLTFGTASSIVAGKPYIVKPESAVTSFSATNVTLKKDLVNTNVGEGTTATMTGTYEAGTVPTDSYIIGIKNGESNLYKVNSTVTLKPFRAYFTVSGEASARIAINFDDDEVTGITLQEIENESGNAGMKDGKYFENGKIVIVKNGVKYTTNGQIVK